MPILGIIASAFRAALLGSVWTTRTTLPTADGWYKIKYANSQYLVGCYDVTGRVLTSPDGITWTTRTPPSTGTPFWTGMAYGNGRWVISSRNQAGTNLCHVYSTDSGATWAAATGPNGYFYDIAYNGSVFSSTYNSSSSSASSTTGTAFTIRTMPSNQGWGGIAAGGSTFVALQDGGATPTSAAATSTDGITWTARTMAAQRWQGVVYDGVSKFVAVARSNNAGAYSTDSGATWTAATLPSGTWVDITYGAGTYIAIGWSEIATSTDGITWTARTAPFLGTGGGSGQGIAFGSPGVVAVKYGSTTYGTTF